MANFPPLASVEDVCELEGIEVTSLSDLQRGKIEALLKYASAYVRRATGQIFTRTTTKIRVPSGTRWTDRLPQKPVIGITKIETIHGNDITGAYTVNGVWGSQSGCNTYFNEDVFVTYEHGYDDIPDHIVGIIVGMVARTMNISKAARTGVASQQIGEYMISFSGWAQGGNLTLSPSESRELARYRFNNSAVIRK